MDGVFRGLAGLLRGIFRGLSPGKSRGAALLVRGKPCPCRLFYSDLHSIRNRFFHLSKLATKCRAETIFFARLIKTQCKIEGGSLVQGVNKLFTIFFLNFFLPKTKIVPFELTQNGVDSPYIRNL